MWHYKLIGGSTCCFNLLGSPLGSVQKKRHGPKWLYEFLWDADGCWGSRWGNSIYQTSFLFNLCPIKKHTIRLSLNLNLLSFSIAGFSLNNPLHQIIVARYSENYTIDFDNFVCCLIRLEMLFSEFLPLQPHFCPAAIQILWRLMAIVFFYLQQRPSRAWRAMGLVR